MSRTCATCETEKADKHFRKAGRGLSKICIDCSDGAGNGTAGDQVNGKPTPIVLHGSLEIPAGLGFRASIEDDRLEIEQDRKAPDGELYTHQLTLSRHEAAKLIDFIATVVERAPEAA